MNVPLVVENFDIGSYVVIQNNVFGQIKGKQSYQQRYLVVYLQGNKTEWIHDSELRQLSPTELSSNNFLTQKQSFLQHNNVLNINETPIDTANYENEGQSEQSQQNEEEIIIIKVDGNQISQKRENRKARKGSLFRRKLTYSHWDENIRLLYVVSVICIIIILGGLGYGLYSLFYGEHLHILYEEYPLKTSCYIDRTDWNIDTNDGCDSSKNWILEITYTPQCGSMSYYKSIDCVDLDEDKGYTQGTNMDCFMSADCIGNASFEPLDEYKQYGFRSYICLGVAGMIAVVLLIWALKERRKNPEDCDECCCATTKTVIFVFYLLCLCCGGGDD